MKIVLTHPIHTSKELEFSDIGLGYLASSLTQAGHSVTLNLHSTDERGLRHLLQEKTDILGIKVLTSTVYEARQTVELARAVSNSHIVIGGPHVSGDPLGALNYTQAEYGFQGEADRSFPQFVSLLAQGVLQEQQESIPGLVYRKRGSITANPSEMINDLDALAFPAWELMPPGKYKSLVCKQNPAAGVITSRGCTNQCSFCAESYKKLRHRSVENVLAEIRYLAERFSVREIHFLDSNFIASKEYIKALCGLILENKLSLAFSAPNGSRLEWVDEEVCSLLKRIGFYRMNVGIESGSPEILRMVCKGFDFTHLSEKISLLRKYGIQVVGNFMLGFPGETKQQMEKTLELAMSLDLTTANFAVYTPMPGTKLYNDLLLEGKLDAAGDFRNHNYVSYENHLSELSPGQLKQFRNRCFLRFMVRWRTVKILYELLQSGLLYNNLTQRIYWMYISRLIKAT